MQQLSGLDASFLYMETPSSPMHVGGLMIYDQSTVPGGVVRYHDILRHIEQRLHLARTFRQKIVRVPLNADHPYWIEDRDFDLDFHVRHIALPAPGDWRQLCIQVARLHARPLDMSRPLWEFTVISGLDAVTGLPPGCFAIVTKIHHAAVDGVSGTELTSAIHDTTSEREQPAAPPDEADSWKPEPEPSPWTLLSRACVNNTMRPAHFARVLGRTVPAVGRAIRLLNRRESGASGARVPRTRFNGTVSPHRVVDGCEFDLDAIKGIRRAVPGATVNDVVLTIVGGALREYLLTTGELPGDSLVAMAPISVRSKDDAATAGNRVSGMMAPLGTDVDDSLARLEAVYQGTQASKQLTDAIGAELMTDYSQFIPSSLAGLAARLSSRMGLANRTNPMFNCVVTNVPGPQEPLYMDGARLVNMWGLGPIGDGMGLIHAVFSYCGKLTVNFTSCREMLPNPAFYAACIQRSFEQLSAAASVPSTVSDDRAAATTGA